MRYHEIYCSVLQELYRTNFWRGAFRGQISEPDTAALCLISIRLITSKQTPGIKKISRFSYSNVLLQILENSLFYIIINLILVSFSFWNCLPLYVLRFYPEVFAFEELFFEERVCQAFFVRLGFLLRTFFTQRTHFQRKSLSGTVEKL